MSDIVGWVPPGAPGNPGAGAIPVYGPRISAADLAVARARDADRQSAQRKAEIARREAADTVRAAHARTLLDRILAREDSVDRLLLAVLLLTEPGDPGGLVKVTEGATLSEALPDLFPLTVHFLDPYLTDHARWDSAQLARTFAVRMRQAGHRPPGPPAAGTTGALPSRRDAPTPGPWWAFPGGSSDITTDAYVFADGTTQLGRPDWQGRPARLNVIAVRRMAELLGIGTESA